MKDGLESDIMPEILHLRLRVILSWIRLFVVSCLDESVIEGGENATHCWAQPVDPMIPWERARSNGTAKTTCWVQ